MNATLTRRPAPDGKPGTLYLLDCRHGTTRACYVPGPTGELDERAIIRALLLKHWQAEGCECTAALWQEYGLPLALRRRLAAVRN